jgi:hypothetical protein
MLTWWKEDVSGNPVDVLTTDGDLTISLVRLRGIFNMKLPDEHLLGMA